MPTSSESNRSWFRPHLSTICLGLLASAVVAFINIPGTQHLLARNHGWPLTYLRREQQIPPDPPGVHSQHAYRIPAIWSLVEDVAEFRPLFLLADLAVVVAIGLVSAVAFEWWRRRHESLTRFSLRTAIIAIFVCAMFFGWIRYRVAIRNSQQPAIVQLEQAGSRIQFDSILPEWLRELVSDDIGRPFDQVRSVDLSYTDASDGDLQPLLSLPGIRSLNLDSTQITDAGLVNIAHLHDLRWLSLDRTAVTDRGLVHLRLLNRLECLGLDVTHVAGPGLQYMKDLDQLEILAIRDTPLADDGLPYLTALPKLWCVYTDRTKVTRSGAQEFKKRSRRNVTIEFDWSAEFGVDAPDPSTGQGGNPFR